MPNESRAPDRDGLARFAFQYAQALAVMPLPEHDARAMIERVLFGEKQGWAACADGLITREELTNLFLANLDTELGTDGMGASVPELFAVAYRILFGDTPG